MNERLTDNEFHSKDKKERACYIQEPRLQAIYDKCFEYEDIDTSPTRLANIKKALEIIKTKKVDAYSFINYFVELNDSYETYVLYFEKPIEIDYRVISEELLTQGEFDLLKEVLYGLPTK